MLRHPISLQSIYAYQKGLENSFSEYKPTPPPLQSISRGIYLAVFRNYSYTREMRLLGTWTVKTGETLGFLNIFP